jgi:hypothetical protein
MYFSPMRITVDIAEKDLKELLKLTGEKKKSSAISKGISELIKRRKAAEFGRLMREGAFDFEFTNDEIEKLG